MIHKYSQLQVGQDLEFPQRPESYYRVISHDLIKGEVTIQLIHPNRPSQPEKLSYQELSNSNAKVTKALVLCTNCQGTGHVAPMPTLGMSRTIASIPCKYCHGTGKIPI